MSKDQMTERDVMRETLKHVGRVRHFLSVAMGELVTRICHHDDTKFGPEEFDSFVVATPKLKGLTYGSPEYRESLRLIRPAIDHHNAHNRHHPEHFPEGLECNGCFKMHDADRTENCDVCGYGQFTERGPLKRGGMNLVDLLEMICDWRAATERHDDGDIRRSIEQNQERFGYSDDVKALLHNTVDLIERTKR